MQRKKTIIIVLMLVLSFCLRLTAEAKEKVKIHYSEVQGSMSERIRISLRILPTIPPLGIPGRTSIIVPEVYQDGHLLYFEDAIFEGIQIICNDNGAEEMVFSLSEIYGESSILLPDSLSGEYEIRLFFGNYCCIGEIIL